MKVIVNVDKNWGIGLGNELLNRIPADIKFFKEKTTGNVVVMGKKTFQSFPGPKALPNRTNIVLTTDKSWSAPNVIVCNSKAELFDELKKYNDNSIFIIGGANVYEQLLPCCDTAYVTKVDSAKPADKFFPNLDLDPDWKIVCESETFTHNNVEFKFLKYRKFESE